MLVVACVLPFLFCCVLLFSLVVGGGEACACAACFVSLWRGAEGGLT